MVGSWRRLLHSKEGWGWGGMVVPALCQQGGPWNLVRRPWGIETCKTKSVLIGPPEPTTPSTYQDKQPTTPLGPLPLA